MQALILILWIYLVIAIIMFVYTLNAFKTTREDIADDSISDSELEAFRKVEGLQEQTGLSDSGLSLYFGLLWPFALYVLLKALRG